MPLIVNGTAAPVPDDPRVSLLDLLREHLGLTSTKKGCNQGACGTCTVLADGERIVSCLALAMQYEGREITMIEGWASRTRSTRCRWPSSIMTASNAAIARPARSARRWQWWTRSGAACRATSPLTWGAETIALDRNELRERMSGNLCRCGAHNGIVDAILAAFGEDRTEAAS